MTVRYYRQGTDDTNFVIPELIQGNMYRGEMLAAALQDVEGPVLDCGAHIGVFSVLLASNGVKQPIHAFEPEPENYALLERNIQGYGSIAPIQKAVGRADGEA